MTAPPVLWRDLRRFTSARVALGRVGNAVPTAAHLAFQAAHAAARDAVHAPLDLAALGRALAPLGFPLACVRSACPDRQTYLVRPDLGRRLAEGPVALPSATGGRLAVLICDGLSAVAAQRHAPTLLAELAPRMERAGLGRPGPVAAACNGRVALGDAVGAAMGAATILVLIGERPGLSSPDGLGAYLTWAPRPGRTDAERNCVSNIRPDGFPPAAAAEKLCWLIARMRALGLSGVGLKDEQPLGTGEQGKASFSEEKEAKRLHSSGSAAAAKAEPNE